MVEKIINFCPTAKQLEAYNYLNDNSTRELLFGGSAGGGKSFLGCAWAIITCLKYKGCRGVIGRAELKAIKESTLLTFWHICHEWGLIKDVDYKYNAIEGLITFSNGSAIYLKDLAANPSDPDFASLGSREYTFAFIDEAAEITETAYDILRSRIRYKLDKFGIVPKILICSNPCKNFVYYNFFKPWRDGTLESYKKFIPAKVHDNPYISKFYIENLETLKGIHKERLLFGNWDYDDDDTKWFNFEKLLDMFGKELPGGKNIGYLSGDIARFGNDLTVIYRWVDLNIEQIYIYQKQSTDVTVTKIKSIMAMHKILNHNVVLDDDGVGGGVVDHIPNVRGFINASRPVELKTAQNPPGAYTYPPKHNFANLKSQCYHYLAQKVNAGEISIPAEYGERYITSNGKEKSIKELIIEDLEQIKDADPDKDGHVQVITKKDIKEQLGRSTDFGDGMMMRMIFELQPKYKPRITGHTSQRFK